MFFVIVFVGVFAFFPTKQAQANSFTDWGAAVAAAVLGTTTDSPVNTSTLSKEKNSQTMALPDAPHNSKLSQENEETESIATMEGSALSANRSVSPASSEDKPKTNISGDQISVYVVHDGDTLSAVAKMFDVTANTIRWANDIPKGGSLKVGQKLVILPVSGIQYTIKKGDTIAKIAKNYGADAGDIRDFNGIEDSSLQVGDIIIIPNGETPTPVVTTVKKIITNIIYTEPTIQTDGYFIRPVRGEKTQNLHGHNGIDFSGRGGLSVSAAAAGEVLISRSSGYNGGYGSYIVINHSNGTQTLYAHLSANFVSAGDTVYQGQLIGNIGSTGRSTGPHLHFEVHGARNPF